MKRAKPWVWIIPILIAGYYTIDACTKEETIYTCGDRNGDGVENELDCIGRDGKDGVDGKDGKDGSFFIYDLLSEKVPSTVCDGYVLFFYADINGSKTIDEEDRLIGEVPVCNGTDGQDGADGAPGQDGADGVTPDVEFHTTSIAPGEMCVSGGTFFEIFVSGTAAGSFTICNGVDGEDFVYNHTYEILLEPETCGEAGGRRIKVYNEQEVLVEQVDLCVGETYGVLKPKVLSLRKYFLNVSTIYKEVPCDTGVGYEVWATIDGVEVAHFFLCPPPPATTN